MTEDYADEGNEAYETNEGIRHGRHRNPYFGEKSCEVTDDGEEHDVFEEESEHSALDDEESEKVFCYHPMIYYSRDHVRSERGKDLSKK
ncbi:hypothetical protein [Veronia pacifica]|uniref:Uncharacterized protein n=1 Tax=Veronia pacifica TaxID=1080227 RepID=A0A1C3ELD0_9GAMM|nr:hypothetical protein [Veronia pacifica]ODA34034.1 hypothetical protein A8L45_08295 [Veronia pacifica]